MYGVFDRSGRVFGRMSLVSAYRKVKANSSILVGIFNYVDRGIIVVK